MCLLRDKATEGIIFLIEVYGAKRNYFYFTTPGFTINLLIEKAKQKFKVNLESWAQNDAGWEFLNYYPVKIYPK